MKTATYTMIDGSKKSFEYDEEAPCKICDLPVVEASMGGTTICPWCDCGIYRDGVKWESMNSEKIKRNAKLHTHDNKRIDDQAFK